MEYIIFDLEWNNAFNYKTGTGMNEIIEIGAVKLNDRLETTDTFKQLIKPILSKRLGSRFKNLTHITMDEIKENGISFEKAFSEFDRWSRGEDVVFLSWSNSDLYTLAANFKRFLDTSHIGFMKKYADAQSYCMHFVSEGDGNQISLANCAKLLNINVDCENLHRALDDCALTACCLRNLFDKKIFSQYIRNCDEAFFERLLFKPYFIKGARYKSFDLSNVSLECPFCNGNVRPLKKYEFSNNTFRNTGECVSCGKKFWIFVRAKQLYDDISISKRLVEVNKHRAKHIKITDGK